MPYCHMNVTAVTLTWKCHMKCLKLATQLNIILITNYLLVIFTISIKNGNFHQKMQFPNALDFMKLKFISMDHNFWSMLVKQVILYVKIFKFTSMDHNSYALSYGRTVFFVQIYHRTVVFSWTARMDLELYIITYKIVNFHRPPH